MSPSDGHRLNWLNFLNTTLLLERTYRAASVNERLYDRIFHAFQTERFTPLRDARMRITFRLSQGSLPGFLRSLHP